MRPSMREICQCSSKMNVKRTGIHARFSRTSLSHDCHRKDSVRCKEMCGSNIRFRTSTSKDVDVGEGEIDADYEMFMKHLQVDGNGYVFEIKNESGRPDVYLTYEVEDDYRILRKMDTPFINSTNSHRSESERLQGRICSPKSDGDIDSYSHQTKNEVKCPLNAHDHQYYFREANADDEYVLFLKHLREDGNSYMFEMSKGIDGSPICVKYEGDDEIHSGTQLYSSDNLIERKGRPLKSERKDCHSGKRKGSMTPGTSNRTVQMQDEGKCSYPDQSHQAYEHNCTSKRSLRLQMSSDYQERLVDVLAKPFDWKEYLELSSAANGCEPLWREVHLRGKTKNYDTNILGHSYLVLFPELAKQVEVADYYKQLTLLRGFFFWLKNLCHEGAFEPWLEEGSSTACHIKLED